MAWSTARTVAELREMLDGLPPDALILCDLEEGKDMFEMALRVEDVCFQGETADSGYRLILGETPRAFKALVATYA
jgi:hypothetical protein